MYSSAFGCNVLKISMRSISSHVSFKTCVPLLIFSFEDLSIVSSGVLKFPIIAVLLSISPFTSVSVFLMYCYVFLLDWASLVAQRLKCLPAVWETWVQSLGQEDPPGEGNGNPLQYSCLENPMDGGSWWVHGVTNGWT